MRKKITLDEIACQAMVEKGFIPDFPHDVEMQTAAINQPAQPVPSMRDLRKLLWVSIDNPDSRDLDQLTYAEEGKMFVAIADVDALIKKGTPIDERASTNTTSVYTPTHVFPMLPLKFSTHLTSLNPHTDRCAIVVEIRIAQDGRFDLIDLYPAWVHNQAKLDYVSVGAFLDHQIGRHPLPLIPGLKEQLLLQDQIAQKIQEYRNRQGALEFRQIELQPVIIDGIPVALEERGSNRAHRLIENTMIAANVGSTRYLKEKTLPILRRVVRTPKKWGRIVILAKEFGTILPPSPDPKALRKFLIERQIAAPLQFPDLSLAMIKLLGRGEYILSLPGKASPGHFDLAEHEYTHATAPNRRFPDLIMQRLLKSALFNGEEAYSKNELTKLAAHCTQKEDDAAKVERRLIKCAAAMVLEKEIGKVFDGMITGAAPKGTWVRLMTPPVEGKVTRNFQGVDVGDFVKVKLIRVDVKNGHIDFARI